MIDRVKRIARNPLANLDDDDPTDVLKLEQINEQKGWKCMKPAKPEEYETTALEHTIIKIGTLLALGFGEAGGAIIATNMAK